MPPCNCAIAMVVRLSKRFGDREEVESAKANVPNLDKIEGPWFGLFVTLDNDVGLDEYIQQNKFLGALGQKQVWVLWGDHWHAVVCVRVPDRRINIVLPEQTSVMQASMPGKPGEPDTVTSIKVIPLADCVDKAAESKSVSVLLGQTHELNESYEGE